jgi:hypothetical protein
MPLHTAVPKRTNGPVQVLAEPFPQFCLWFTELVVLAAETEFEASAKESKPSAALAASSSPSEESSAASAAASAAAAVVDDDEGDDDGTSTTVRDSLLSVGVVEALAAWACHAQGPVPFLAPPHPPSPFPCEALA